jgi:hypothetical protein
MRKIIITFLNKLKNHPDIWFFFGFLLTFSFSIRKVAMYFPIKGTFNEYTGIYVYLSDIFLILAIGSWLFILLLNNLTKLSNSSVDNLIKSEIMAYISKNNGVYNFWIKKVIPNLFWILPLFLVIWSFVSIIWSQNQAIAFFRSFKLLEFYFLYLYIIFRIVPRGTISNVKFFNVSFWIILFSGIFQSLIGITQFISQKSLGLTFLKESIISQNMPGVAKIILEGEKYIRSYGLFPHPNILGGFLLFSIILTWMYVKLFYVYLPAKQMEQSDILRKENVPHGTFMEANFMNRMNKTNAYFLFKKWLFNKIWLIKGLMLIQGIALLLTFSKSAIIGLVLASSYILYKLYKIKHNQLFHTFSAEMKQLFRIERLRIIILSILVVIFSFFLFSKPNLNSLFLQSLNERMFYLNVSRETIIENYVFGLGSGQFVWGLQHFSQKVIMPWEYQPIHNVFLLIWSELGLIGLGLFIWLFWVLFHVEQYKTSDSEIIKNNKTSEEQSKEAENSKNNFSILQNNICILSSNIILTYFKAILIGFVFIMLFDHYFWDIQQGSLMLWMVMGVIQKMRYIGNTKNLAELN